MSRLQRPSMSYTGQAFMLTINTDNDTFFPLPYHEVARLLRAIAQRIDTVSGERDTYADNENGWAGHFQTIFDSNGNDVGRYAFKPVTKGKRS